jgi:GTP-binding protein HflX
VSKKVSGSSVLREIGADAVLSRLLLNKIDRVSEADRAALRAKHPNAILLSANSAENVAALHESIIAFFETAMVEDQLVLPYAKQGLLNDVYENALVPVIHDILSIWESAVRPAQGKVH